MLANFAVSNFRNFSERFNFSFETEKHYEFNTDNVQDCIIKHSIAYGHNGCGKSNLGIAILDLTCHINDVNIMHSLKTNYLNGDARKDELAVFEYKFKFGNDIVEYSYGKSDVANTRYEKLLINNELVVSLNRDESEKLFVKLAGTESLRSEITNSNISAIKYIKSNSILDMEDKNAQLFTKFIDFVSGMIFFRTLTQNADYFGQIIDTNKRLSRAIIEANKLGDFEKFLNESGVRCKLTVIGEEEDQRIAFEYKNKNVEFSYAASTGTMSLGIFYYWWLKVDSGELTFAYIDEFDAYYHYSLSQAIVTKMNQSSGQTILTSHNLSILSNDLLRPDCYFVLADKQYPLYKLVDKDLRKAHNLEKIFKGLTYEY